MSIVLIIGIVIYLALLIPTLLLKKPIVIVNKYLLPPSAVGFSFAPFVVFRSEKYKTDKNMNHERIHFEQQKELILIPFYVIYILNFIFNLIRMNNLPYRSIIFEKEAFGNENNFEYLKTRKRYTSWLSLIKK